MRKMKKWIAGILITTLVLSIMTGCGTDGGNTGTTGGNLEKNQETETGSGEEDNSSFTEKKDDEKKDTPPTDKEDDKEKNPTETDSEKDEDKKNEEADLTGKEDKETPIEWKDSLLSKIYSKDIRNEGGTARLNCTQSEGNIPIEFIRTSSRKHRKILEYCGANAQNRYLWQMDTQDRTVQRWKINEDGTYNVLESGGFPLAFYITETITTGSKEWKTCKIRAGEKEYQEKIYYTETVQGTFDGVPLEYTYYYDAGTLKLIRVISEKYQSMAYLTNISLTQSSALMDDADSILTEEETKKIDPDSYTPEYSVE